MPFTLPQFNCLFDAWRFDGFTLTWSKISFSDVCQWYVNPRIQAIAWPQFNSEEIIFHYLRVPMGTDIREGDIVEVESGELWFYQVIETERVHKNFPNEYLVGFCNNLDAENTPFVLATEDEIQLQTEGGSLIFTELY